jgi:hypothetical protein
MIADEVTASPLVANGFGEVNADANELPGELSGKLKLIPSAFAYERQEAASRAAVNNVRRVMSFSLIELRTPDKSSARLPRTQAPRCSTIKERTRLARRFARGSERRSFAAFAIGVERDCKTGANMKNTLKSTMTGGISRISSVSVRTRQELGAQFLSRE